MQDTQFKNELIDIIDEKIAENGEGLPEVTAADNGRVLGVDDGEWKAVEPSGGILYFPTVMDADGDGYLGYVDDLNTWHGLSYQDLLDIVDEGKIVYFWAHTDDRMFLDGLWYNEDTQYYTASFSSNNFQFSATSTSNTLIAD